MEINVEPKVTTDVFQSNPANSVKIDPANFEIIRSLKFWSMAGQCLGNLPTISENNGPIGLKLYCRIALAKVVTALEFQVPSSTGLGVISKQQIGPKNVTGSHVCHKLTSNI